MNYSFILFSLACIAHSMGAQPEDPVKTYLARYNTEESDRVIGSMLRTLHRILPDDSEATDEQKKKLEEEFEAKFGISIKDANMHAAEQEKVEDKLKFVMSIVSTLFEQAQLKADENYAYASQTMRLAYGLLFYTLEKLSDRISVDMANQAHTLLEEFKTKFPRLSILESQFNDFGLSGDELQEKILGQLIQEMPAAQRSISKKTMILAIVGVIVAVVGLKIVYDYLKWRADHPSMKSPKSQDPILAGGSEQPFDGGFPPAPPAGGDGTRAVPGSPRGRKQNSPRRQQRSPSRAPAEETASAPTSPRRQRTTGRIPFGSIPAAALQAAALALPAGDQLLVGPGAQLPSPVARTLSARFGTLRGRLPLGGGVAS